MNKKTKILLIGAGIWYMGEGLFGPLLAVFSEKIGGNVLDLSWAWAMYLVVYGVLSYVFGKVADRNVDKGQLMVTGYALNALCTFGYIFVDSTTSLLFVQAGLGIAGAMATPTWNALFDEATDPSVDGTSWGLYECIQSIISGITIILGAYIVMYFSFKSLFIIMGCIQILATLYQAKILYLDGATPKLK